MQFTLKHCEHLDALDLSNLKVKKEYACEDCLKISGTWVHLRTCQECGKTLCCDSSPNKHATKHFHRSGHPVVSSAEPNENWAYCYENKTMRRW